MECKIVIFLPLAGGCPETEETTKSGRETVSGVWCYENGRVAFIEGWSTIQTTIHGRVLMHSTIKQRVGAHIRNETHFGAKKKK